MTVSLSSLFTSESSSSSSKKKSKSKGKLEKKEKKLENLFSQNQRKEFVKPDVKIPDIDELRRLKEAKINPKKLNKKAKKRLISELKKNDFGETSDQEDGTDTEVLDDNENDPSEHIAKKPRKAPSANQIRTNYENLDSDKDEIEGNEEDSENELEEALKELRETSGKGIDITDLDNSQERDFQESKASKKTDETINLNVFPVDNERDERTLFVGNLHVSIKKQKLSAMFEKFGAIESIRIRSVAVAPLKIDEKGNDKLLRKVATNKKMFDTEVKDTFNAYIVFKEKSSVEAALQLNNFVVCEKHIKVDRVGTNSNLQDPLRSIFIGNVYFNASEEDLRTVLIEALKENDDEYQDDTYFDTCIESVRIVRDSAQVGKGFAFALFRDKILVSKILRIESPITLNNRILRISACGKRTKGKRGETTMTRAAKRALKFGGSSPLPGARGRLQKKLAKTGMSLSERVTSSSDMGDSKKKRLGKAVRKNDLKEKINSKSETKYKPKKKNSKGGEKDKTKQSKVGKKRTADGKKIRLAGKRNDPNRNM